MTIMLPENGRPLILRRFTRNRWKARRVTIRRAIVNTVHPSSEWQEVGRSADPSLEKPCERDKAKLALAGPGLGYRAKGARILIVDDDVSMRHKILDYLQIHDFRANCAISRPDLMRVMVCREPDLILLDLRAEVRNGLEMLREIRSHSDVPVILTTDHACDEVDRILGLELGADDYLVMPFSLRELLAKIRALLRRNEIARKGTRRSPERGGYRFAGWEVYRRSRRLISPHGAEIPLTKGEYALLIAFLSAPQRPLSREHLLQATRIRDDAFDRSIDVQVMRLRRKLHIDPAAARFIQTKRGVGYVFAIPVESY